MIRGKHRVFSGRPDLVQNFEKCINLDELVKSRKSRFSVIPAKAGIQSFQSVKENLDSGLHRSDDFLRDYQIRFFNKLVNGTERAVGISFRRPQYLNWQNHERYTFCISQF
jgi:hypothetical protein